MRAASRPWPLLVLAACGPGPQPAEDTSGFGAPVGRDHPPAGLAGWLESGRPVARHLWLQARATAVLAGEAAQDEAALAPAVLAPAVPGELLITFAPALTEQHTRAWLGERGLQARRRLAFAIDPRSPLNRTWLVRLPAGGGSGAPGSADLAAAGALDGQATRALLAASRELAQEPEVEAAQPNWRYWPAAPPNDTWWSRQWGHDNAGGNAAFAYGGLRGPDPRVAGADVRALAAYDQIASQGWTPAPVTVAVIDSGVDYTLADLAAAMLPGWDFYDDDADPIDNVASNAGHGTHVAGVIAAVRGNNLGVAGLAANARVMPLRMLGPSGGTSADTIAAIDHAVSHGARVINASFATTAYDAATYTAVSGARAAGVLVVAAAGNSGTDNDRRPYYPAAFDLDNVLAVAASTAWKDLAEYSCYGLVGVDLAAPGSEIISTVPPALHSGLPTDTYQIAMDVDAGPAQLWAAWSGTSMAAPHVSAAAALLWGLGPQLWTSWGSMNDVQRMLAVRERLLQRSRRWAALDQCCATAGHLDLAALLASDSLPPATPSLALAAIGWDSLTFRVTAPGDDGSVGRANWYDLRCQAGTSLTWATASVRPHVWPPGPAGRADYPLATGLQAGQTYTCAIAAVDAAGNSSPASAPVSATTSSLSVAWSDNIEAGVNGWTTGGTGTAWSRTTTASHSPSYSWTDSAGANYLNNSDSWLATPAIPTAGQAAVRLRYWERYAIESSVDVGWTELRWYTGSAWTGWEYARLVTGTDGTWRQVDLPVLAAGTQVQFRFRLQTDGTNRLDGWYLDDVQVLTRPAATHLLFEDGFGAVSNWQLAGQWAVSGGQLSDSPGDYPNNYRASATLAQPLDLGQAVAVELAWDQTLFDFEPGFDWFYVDYSLDDPADAGGHGWRTLAVYSGSLSSAQPVRLDASLLAGQPRVRFRVRSLSDYDLTADGAALDNLRVWVIRDECPADPASTVAGPCGCGVPATDSDGDGTLDCHDGCPADPSKTAPGLCGCGTPDSDGDGDGTPDCHDDCPADPLKTAPGACGCGTPDVDGDGDGTPNCHDLCPLDPLKTRPGLCGCGVAEELGDADGDGTRDCQDGCRYDPSKLSPGLCGCGRVDVDDNHDGLCDTPGSDGGGPDDGAPGGDWSGGDGSGGDLTPAGGDRRRGDTAGGWPSGGDDLHYFTLPDEGCGCAAGGAGGGYDLSLVLLGLAWLVARLTGAAGRRRPGPRQRA